MRGSGGWVAAVGVSMLLAGTPPTPAATPAVKADGTVRYVGAPARQTALEVSEGATPTTMRVRRVLRHDQDAITESSGCTPMPVGAHGVYEDFACAFTPTEADVGRTTFSVVARDALGQTASAVRVVDVGRLTPRGLSARTSPRRDRRRPYRFSTSGVLELPPGVGRARGCDGDIRVQVLSAKRTISTRIVGVRSDCSYRSTVEFNVRGRVRDKLTILTRYDGSAILAPIQARRVTVRTR